MAGRRIAGAIVDAGRESLQRSAAIALPSAPGILADIPTLNPRLTPVTLERHAVAARPQIAGYAAWATWARGIGIILVVFGHTWRGTPLALRTHAPMLTLLDSAIYGIHMPLFFLLSGLFVERSAIHSANSFLVKKLKTIIYPYFLWTVLQGGMACLLRGYTNSNKQAVFSKILLWSLYRPYAQFWFLYVLAVCMGLFLLLYKLRLKPPGIFLIAGGFCALGLLRVPMGPWGIVYQVQWNFVYFAAGAALSPLLISQLPESRTGFLASATLASFALAFATAARGWHDSAGLTMLLATSGITGCISLATVLARTGRLRILELLGRQSLPIFLAHVIFAAGARTILTRLVIPHLPEYAALGIVLSVCTVAGLFLPIALAALADRMHLKGLFAWP